MLPLLKERAKTHLDIAESVSYLIHDGAVDIDLDAAVLLTNDTKATLLDLSMSLNSVKWDLSTLKETINNFLEEKDLRMQDIGLPLRAAITGKKKSPSIIDIMVALGRSETNTRLQVACK